MSATGGTATDIVPSSYSQGSAIATAWSPDGNSIACTYVPRVGTTDGILVISMNGGGYSWLTPATYSDSCPCFSPDNSKIAFYRTKAGGATPGIYECDFSGTNPQLVVPDPSTAGLTGGIISLAWSPFLENQKFVGTGGTLSSSASGFLLSQNGSQFASLLTFVATTPSKATLTAATTSGGSGPLIYTLGADAVTNVSFTNVYNGAHTSFTLASTPSVIVSIDGTTGFVDFVAPGIISKKNPAPSLSGHIGSAFTGQFSAIYNSTGKNLAPTGATIIEVDPKSGKLISFR